MSEKQRDEKNPSPNIHHHSNWLCYSNLKLKYTLNFYNYEIFLREEGGQQMCVLVFDFKKILFYSKDNYRDPHLI